MIRHPAGVAGYEELTAGACLARIRGVPVVVADLEVLIAIKAVTGRPKDREWFAQLGYIHDRGKAP